MAILSPQRSEQPACGADGALPNGAGGDGHPCGRHSQTQLVPPGGALHHRSDSSRADDGASPRLDAYLFRLNLPFLAGPLLRELEDRYGGGEAQILLLHDGPYVACLVYDGPGELGRFSAPLRPVVSWGFGRMFDFSRPLPL